MYKTCGLLLELIRNISYAVHGVVMNLGEECSLALLMFHNFTGCDIVSGFFNIGKATAWKTWKIYNEVTPVFIDLRNCPNTVSAENHKPRT